MKRVILLFTLLLSFPFVGKELSRFILASSTFSLKEIITERDEVRHSINSHLLTKHGTTRPNIFEIDLKALKETLTQPSIRHITLRRRLPDRLWVEVEWREPLAIIPTSASFLGVDKEGVIFPLKSTPNLPFITGMKIERIGEKVEDQNLLKVLDFIRMARENGLLERISEFNLPSMIAFTTSGIKIYLSEEFDSELIQKLRVVLAYLEGNNLRRDIDLRFNKIILKS